MVEAPSSPLFKNQSFLQVVAWNWMFLYFRANKLIRIKVWVVEEEKPLLWPFYTHSNCASSIWSSLYAPREASSSILCKGLWLLNDSDGKKNESFYNSFNLEKSVVDQNVENVHRADQHLHDRVQMEFWPSSCHYEVTSLLKIWPARNQTFPRSSKLDKKLKLKCNQVLLEPKSVHS